MPSQRRLEPVEESELIHRLFALHAHRAESLVQVPLTTATAPPWRRPRGAARERERRVGGGGRRKRGGGGEEERVEL